MQRQGTHVTGKRIQFVPPALLLLQGQGHALFVLRAGTSPTKAGRPVPLAEPVPIHRAGQPRALLVLQVNISPARARRAVRLAQPDITQTRAITAGLQLAASAARARTVTAIP